MEEYKPIPVSVAKEIAEKFKKSIVIIAAWDPIHGLLHTTTSGRNKQECEWAALGGKKVTEALGADYGKRTIFEDINRKYWYIWSNEHKSWWRSNHRGYTTDKNQAGLYETAEAMKIVKGANEYQYADVVPNEAMIPQFDHKHTDDV